MSNRTLRTMYVGMLHGRATISESGSKAQPARAAYGDVACFAAALAGLGTADVVFGCREDGVLDVMRVSGSLPRFADGVGRLYAAAGAAMTFRAGSGRVAMAFFERHEVGGARWDAAMQAVAELPLILVVLPRWKGAKATDLCVESRRAGVPGIAVDAADAIAVYRVAQESLARARMGGGAALIEGVRFEIEGESAGQAADPVETLAAYLRRRGVASQSWLQRIGSIGVPARGKGGDTGR